MPEKPFFFDLEFETLKDELISLGQPEFRARQIWQAFYCNLVETPDQITTISKELRQTLSQKYDFTHLAPSNRLVSTDNETVKTLFELPDGRAIEAVLMHYDERQTLCISSQAGCAMGCVFCGTGQMGFARNLSCGEIVEQALYYARLLKKSNQAVTNIVVMGMGEPFHNYDAVLTAIDRLNDPAGFNLGARRFTISTVGLVPMIKRFAAEKRQINLAISLHAANDALRASLLPIERKYPLADLMQACKEYIDTTKRRLTFEWALIQGVNDTEKDALELATLVKGMLCHVNIIPLNPTDKFNGKTTTHERAVAFRSTLEKNGIPCTIRLRRGIDINAGCGQLASTHK
ncbi:MAG: 23S rRNA (adenine(2503)-C(2))-methyltransferase RlmN [Anaerolinea sp.]|nr:23S rRNA (adenine(2503)-C(2))-methyltransferase RlmN [Anaerolinea sp.]